MSTFNNAHCFSNVLQSKAATCPFATEDLIATLLFAASNAFKLRRSSPLNPPYLHLQAFFKCSLDFRQLRRSLAKDTGGHFDLSAAHSIFRHPTTQFCLQAFGLADYMIIPG